MVRPRRDRYAVRMRDLDDGVGGACEEDDVTQRWLEDMTHYVRMDDDGGRWQGEAGSRVEAASRTEASALDRRR